MVRSPIGAVSALLQFSWHRNLDFFFSFSLWTLLLIFTPHYLGVKLRICSEVIPDHVNQDVPGDRATQSYQCFHTSLYLARKTAARDMEGMLQCVTKSVLIPGIGNGYILTQDSIGKNRFFFFQLPIEGFFISVFNLGTSDINQSICISNWSVTISL